MKYWEFKPTDSPEDPNLWNAFKREKSRKIRFQSHLRLKDFPQIKTKPLSKDIAILALTVMLQFLPNQMCGLYPRWVKTTNAKGKKKGALNQGSYSRTWKIRIYKRDTRYGGKKKAGLKNPALNIWYWCWLSLTKLPTEPRKSGQATWEDFYYN